MELRKEIIAKFKNGVRVSDPASRYNMAKSTISTFLKKKEVIKAADVANGVTIVHGKQRPQIMDEVSANFDKKELDGDRISDGITCEKSLRIYADLLKKTPSTSAIGESGLTFKTCRGRIHKWKHRSRLHSVVRHGEAANSNKEAAEKYIVELHDFVYA